MEAGRQAGRKGERERGRVVVGIRSTQKYQLGRPGMHCKHQMLASRTGGRRPRCHRGDSSVTSRNIPRETPTREVWSLAGRWAGGLAVPLAACLASGMLGGRPAGERRESRLAGRSAGRAAGGGSERSDRQLANRQPSSRRAAGWRTPPPLRRRRRSSSSSSSRTTTGDEGRKEGREPAYPSLVAHSSRASERWVGRSVDREGERRSSKARSLSQTSEPATLPNLKLSSKN